MAVLRDIKYMRIASEIEDEIKKGNLLPGAPVYSIREIIRKWNVSLFTANHALSLLTSRGIICRIHGKGCFVNKPLQHRKNRIFHVAYTIYRQSNFKLERLIHEPESRLIDLLRDNYCILKRLDKVIYRDAESVLSAMEGMDGAVISLASVPISRCLHMYKLRIPVVLVHGDIICNLPFHQVLPDPMPGLREMFVRAEQFHFKGVIIVCHNHLNGKSRARSCREAAIEFGYSDIREIVFERTENSYTKAQDVIPFLSDYLIFTCSCLIAFPFMDAFDNRSLRPSVDYHLVCYDEIESIGVHPKASEVMTTIGYSHEKLCQTASNILLSEMKHSSGLIKKIMIPTALTVRRSGLAT